MGEVKKIFIGSDHAGFNTKERIKKYLEKKKLSYKDLTPKLIEGDDYPDVAFNVAENVTKTKNSRGILVCGSGTGMEIAANKVKGIRAFAPYDTYTAKMSRKDNNTNVVAFRGRGFDFKLILRMLNVWIKTPFSNAPRHVRRIKKISKYEK